MEITETPVTPFRVFNDLGYKTVETPENWGGLKFSIRPMSYEEREEFRLAKSVFQKSKDFEGAVKRAGVNIEDIGDMVLETPNVGDTVTEKHLSNLDKWLKIEKEMVVDADATIAFSKAEKKVILSCVRDVTVDGDVKPFDDNMYSSVSSESVIKWFIDKIEGASNLNNDEVSAL